MQKIFFEILVQTALTVGLFWTILKLTPKFALLSLTILYPVDICDWISLLLCIRENLHDIDISSTTLPTYLVLST